MKGLSLFLMMTFAAPTMANIGHKPHLDLEMNSDEYRHILRNTKSGFETAPDPAVETALKIGERLSKWIALVNATRSNETAIRLTSQATRRGIPIDKPNTYSPSIIEKETATLMSELPSTIKEIITSTDELPSDIPIDDETFIIHARKLDRNYQSAARYKSLIQWRSEYIEAAKDDVRGYYYLTSNKITNVELIDIRTIPLDKIAPLKVALSQICLNSNEANCRHKVDKAFENNKVAELYSKYFPNSKKIWDAFFVIPLTGRRNDVNWSGTMMTVPSGVTHLNSSDQ